MEQEDKQDKQDKQYSAQTALQVKHEANIALYLILTLFTCGIFNMYWNYRQMEACNELVGRKEFDFWLWFLLCFVTLGIYHIFYQYNMGRVIVEIQRLKKIHLFDNLPVVSVIATLLGASIVVDCIHQAEINKLLA